MAASAFKAYLSLIPKLSADAKSNIKGELGGINATSSGKSVGSTLSSGITSGLSAGKIAIGTAIGSVVSTGLNSITSSISDAVSRVDTLNSFPKIMQNLGISSDDAKTAINRLSDGISGLPTTLDSAASGVTKFVSKNGDIDKSTKYFLAMNDAIVAGGQSSEIQASAVEQLSQAYSKGTMDMTEWRSLQTAMPAQLNQVAQAMGMTTDALGEGLRNGTISMDEFMDKIVELDSQGVNGLASFHDQAQSATGGIATSFANLKTAVVRNVANIINAFQGEGGGISQFLGIITQGVNAVGNALTGLAAKAGAIMPVINNALRSVYPTLQTLQAKVSGFALAFVQAHPQITEFANSVKAGVTNALVSVSSAFGRIGEYVSGLYDSFGGFSGIVSSIIDSFNNAYNAILPVIQGVIEGVKGFANSFMSAFNVEGAGSSIISLVSLIMSLASPIGLVRTLFDNFGTQLTNLFSVIGTNLVPILSTLGGMLGDIASAIMPAINSAVTSFMSIFNTVITTVIQLASAILPVVTMLLQQLAPIISQIAQFIASLIVSLAPIIEQLVSALMPVIVQITQVLMNIITAIAPAVFAFMNLIMSVLNAILPVISNVLSVIVSVLTVIINIIGTLITVIGNVVAVIASAIGTVITIISDILSVVVTAFGVMTATITGATAAIAMLISDCFNTVLQIISTIINAVGTIITGFFSLIDTVFSNIANTINNAVRNAFNAVKSAFDSMYNAISSAVITALDVVTSVFSSIYNTITNAVNDAVNSVINAFNNIVSAISNSLSSAVNYVASFPSQIMSIFSGIGSWLYDSGASLIEGFVNGVLSAIDWAASTVSDALSSIRDLFPFSPAKTGPFSGKGWTLYSGEAIIESIGEGITLKAGEARKAAENALSDIRGSLDGDMNVKSVFEESNNEQKQYDLIVAAVTDALYPLMKEGVTLNADHREIGRMVRSYV